MEHAAIVHTLNAIINVVAWPLLAAVLIVTVLLSFGLYRSR